MKKTVKVFTGSEVTVSMLKEELENHEITSMMRSDFQSGISAGFSGGVPSATDLYVNSSDLEKAALIINDVLGEREI